MEDYPLADELSCRDSLILSSGGVVGIKWTASGRFQR